MAKGAGRGGGGEGGIAQRAGASVLRFVYRCSPGEARGVEGAVHVESAGRSALRRCGCVVNRGR